MGDLTAIPPSSSEAERAVLGSIIIDPKALDLALRRIGQNDAVFYDLQNAAIYRVMREVAATGSAVDLITLSDHLRSRQLLANVGGAEYLTELINGVATAAHIEHYVNIILRKYSLRQIINESLRLINAAQQEDFDGITSISTGIGSIRDQATETLPVYQPTSYTHEFLDQLEARRSESAPRLCTGIQSLDGCLWGLTKGELVIIGARPGVGKSAFLLNISANLVRSKKRVIYFSTEMNVQEKYCRLLPILSGLDAYKFRRAAFTAEEWALIGQHSEWLHKENNFMVCDNSSPNAGQIASIVRKERPDVVVLDYLGLMTFAKADRRDLEIGAFTKAMKTLARSEDVAILCASQLNRQVDHRESKIPTLGDLRDSGSIEQDADTVILLYNEPGEFPSDTIILNAQVAKNRHGSMDLVKLVFEKRTQRIREHSPEPI